MSTNRQTNQKIFPLLNFAIASLLLWGFGVQTLAQEINSSPAEEAIEGTTEELEEGSLVEEGIDTDTNSEPTRTVNPTGSINPGTRSDPNGIDANDESGLDANVDATDESGLDANVDATDSSEFDANTDATENDL
ncbi:hypothetical protein [Oscillatoria salina]|uniref:hypothetical protein n=1 Tax=Oscillatoria salina TaxID=331517 RepID=UPI0013B6FA67|nr:hypothetical protein [Oscillatoria salina]MBZ8178649.1 hypothetical protein [Oscillatoria salina IIICB1]NET87305.1 hypothetical protein [Kamptonema sp. SIO1D9]